MKTWQKFWPEDLTSVRLFWLKVIGNGVIVQVDRHCDEADVVVLPPDDVMTSGAIDKIGHKQGRFQSVRQLQCR